MEHALSASQEDYLEAIYQLSTEKGYVRVRDIAAYKGVSMPSVNGAIKRLSKRELVQHDRYDHVELTDEGKTLAAGISDRHLLLRRFLTEILGVDEVTADSDACALEHHVSQPTMDAFIEYFSSIDAGGEG
jgi:DtxR family transcriptional regulator, Mn-dependent transcriptional regulator